MRAAACAAFASMLRWESTTPFGTPSEPEVNRMAAQSSGLRCDQRLFASQQAADFVGERDGRADVFEIDDRDLAARARRPGCPSLPFSMKAREVTMVSICAALQAARMLAAPAVKLIMAGTRPADISARTVTTAPLAFGSITPTARPSAAQRHELAPRTAAPISSACR